MELTRTRLLPAAVLCSLLALPASALGASATVTGDAGAPVAIPATIRNMDPVVEFAFAPDEKQYGAVVLGPGGAPASSSTSCLGTESPTKKFVEFQGNGTYTVVLRVSKNDRDFNCAEAVEQRLTFTINASTFVTPPSVQPLLMRRPDSLASIEYTVPVDRNPGASSHELSYAAGATLGPDGGISGPSTQAFVDSSTGLASIRFTKPGRYTFVARARRGSAFSPFSPPVFVDVVAPFDLSFTSFPDARGPSYKVKGTVREPSARGGRVTVSIGRGHKARKFRRLGRAKIRSGGTFTQRFRLGRPGKYTLRYSFAGSSTVAKGVVKEKITISRRFF